MQQNTITARNKGGLILFLTLVYAANWNSVRKELWAQTSSAFNAHWLQPMGVMGDFSVARFSTEKIDGKSLSRHQLSDFNGCQDICNLQDIRSTGINWSWHINSDGSSRIPGRLDRIVCNQTWIHILPQSSYANLPLSTSDHSPMLLNLSKEFSGAQSLSKFSTIG